MYYFFLADESMFAQTPGIMPGPDMNQGAGYLTPFMANFFKTTQVVKDDRPTRLTILSDKARGESFLYTDSDRYDSGIDPFSGVQVAEYTKLFNTIEQIALMADTAQNINDYLVLDSASFGGYQANSLTISSATVVLNMVGASGQINNVPIKTWMEFTFNLNGVLVPMHIWLGEDSFKADYPYTTITDIIYPADPATFLNMSDYANVIDAVAQSATYTNSQLATDVENQDHNGMMSFITRYHNDNFMTEYNFSFGVLYKGRAPRVAEARVAIREDLIATEDGSGSLLATEEVWKNTFPDLWVTGRFYIIPNWSDFNIRPTKTIYPSIANHKSLYEDAVTILPAYNTTNLANRLETIMNSATRMLLTSVPDDLNDPNDMVLLDKHPTYLAVDATTASWDDQEMDTREFNQALSDTLGVLLGGVNVFGYLTTTTDDGREWLTFVSNYFEFLVLKKDSHPGI